MKHHLEIFIRLILFVTFFQSCEVSHSVQDDLYVAEINMQNNPDSALAILEAIDTEDLNNRKLRARYALLYSMALDKNYIDLKNDSIIAPAVSFYKNHGTPDDKLKTYYYWGRIAMNAQEYEEAISRFVQAERHADRAEDKIAVGRLYKALTSVYQYCYDTYAIIETASKSASLYMSLKDTSKYITSMFDLTSGYLNKLDTLNARNSLCILHDYWSSMNLIQKSNYYANLLILNSHTSDSSLYDLLEAYKTDVKDERIIKWLPVASAYYKCGNYKDALESLERYHHYQGPQNDNYFWLSGLVYEELSESYNAMHSYKQYINRTDKKLGYLLDADIRFIKERYENSLRVTRNKYLLIILVLSVILISIVSILIIRKIQRINHARLIKEEKLSRDLQSYISMYDAAMQEIKNLDDALKYNRLDITVKLNLIERLNLLNKFIASNMVPNFSESASKELRHLMDDKKHFIESTRISFLIQHPDFVKYLKNKQLTDSEIGYCCLYLMGLKGKDISSYMGNGHYKLSSLIRKKLGLNEHDTNLDIYLREILVITSS